MKKGEVVSKISIAVVVTLSIFLIASSFAYDPSTGDFSKENENDIRLLSYNTFQSFISEPAKDEAFNRILTAIKPDIIVFEEITGVGESKMQDRLNSILPYGNPWHTHDGSYGGMKNVLASRYPLSMKQKDTIPGSSTRGVTMALVELPASTKCIYIMGVHLKADVDQGDEDDRQKSCDAIAAWMGDARDATEAINDNISLASDTPMVVMGDFNFLPQYLQSDITIRTGDIQDNATYGPDVKGDWDNTDITDAHPADPYTGETYTWRNPTPTPPPMGDVVINELAWGGTAAYYGLYDEWIELYNNTDSSINLTGYGLYEGGGATLIITLSGIIEANGYFLVERTEDDTVSDILGDTVGSFSGSGLHNEGEHIQLKSSEIVIDEVNCADGWFAGTASPDYYTMERIDPEVDGNDPSNWCANNGVDVNGLDAGSNPLNGTAKWPNSCGGINDEYTTLRLDRFYYTDSVLTTPHSFILNTLNMNSEQLANAGLQQGDTHVDYTSDHLPIVMDVRFAGVTTPTPTPVPQAEIILNGSSFSAGNQFTATFQLNESIDRSFTAYAVVILPSEAMLNALTLDTPLKPVATNVPRLTVTDDPFTFPLINTTIPAGAPKGTYELVVAFFDPGQPITGRDDAFLEASGPFTIQ